MELYGKYTGKMTTNYTWISSVYYQDYVNMAFPIQFVNTPYLVPVLCRDGSNSALNIIPRTIDANGFNYYVISMGGSDSNIPYSISYTAIGYWK